VMFDVTRRTRPVSSADITPWDRPKADGGR
jgi:hypothetical protein